MHRRYTSQLGLRRKRTGLFHMWADGYIERALQECTHTTLPKQHHYDRPSIIVVCPSYGAKVQYVKDDTTRPLDKTKISYLHIKNVKW